MHKQNQLIKKLNAQAILEQPLDNSIPFIVTKQIKQCMKLMEGEEKFPNQKNLPISHKYIHQARANSKAKLIFS